MILFTAEMPQGMFNLILNPLQWAARAQFYHYWMVTKYPPFDWEE